MIRRAAIDVGTNSVRVLVADVATPCHSPFAPRRVPTRVSPGLGSRPVSAPQIDPRGRRPAGMPSQSGRRRGAPGFPRLRPVLRRIAITRLGEGLRGGQVLRPDAIDRTAMVVNEYIARAEASGVPCPIVVGTYALRTARNRDAFLGRVRRPTRVLTGPEEARLGFQGALAGLGVRDARSRTLVVDIGGGSVELTWGTLRGVQGDCSLPLGCVVLTQAFLTRDPPAAADVVALAGHVARVLDPVLRPLRRRRMRLVGVGGTITTMAALAQRLDPYDPDRVHGYRLSTAQVGAVTAQLLARPLDARRRLPGLQPERADVIVAGALVLRHLLDRLGRRVITVSEADLLWALVLGL